MIRPKKTPGHIKYWPRIDPFFSKNQNFDPKHKIPNNQWEKLNRFHYLKGDTDKQALKLICQRFFNIQPIILKFAANASFFKAV